jgi:acyl-CoA thioester hydrolase
MGHMNVMWYAGKFDEATWQFAGAVGLTARAMAAAHCGMVAVEQVTAYRAELLAGDLISIHTRVLDVGERSIRFVHEMRREPEGTIAATTTLVGVHIDTTTRRSRPLPAQVVDTIRARYITSDAASLPASRTAGPPV